MYEENKVNLINYTFLSLYQIKNESSAPKYWLRSFGNDIQKKLLPS